MDAPPGREVMGDAGDQEQILKPQGRQRPARGENARDTGDRRVEHGDACKQHAPLVRVGPPAREKSRSGERREDRDPHGGQNKEGARASIGGLAQGDSASRIVNEIAKQGAQRETDMPGQVDEKQKSDPIRRVALLEQLNECSGCRRVAMKPLRYFISYVGAAPGSRIEKKSRKPIKSF
ncbi:MAG: hypothetical protein N2444_00975 [Methylocystis sp.]|nr:hypothetical protein [Methylocystis sp.]